MFIFIATKHRKSSSENISSVLPTTTVDGVSSTSPEPKSAEIVSTSADPGVGIGTESIPKYLNDALATGEHLDFYIYCIKVVLYGPPFCKLLLHNYIIISRYTKETG